MPARVVIVHDEPETLHPLADALVLAGHGVARFDDALAAWDALREARTVELLMTRVRFGHSQPQGLGLFIRTRARRPELKVIFIGPLQSKEAVQHFGEFLPTPVDVPKAVATVKRVLA
jgi:DNA-binding NtrC family response regulator